MKLFALAGWVFAGLMSLTGGVYAQNIITALTVGYNSSATIIKVDFVRPLSKLPDTEFVIGSSPHIVLEFSDVASGLDQPVYEFAEGGLRSANIIQFGERTRLLLYLNQMFPYNIRADGNSLLIALQGNAGSAESAALRPAETKQDAQKKILISEANARLKAEQEARAAEEEKARQAAEAEAAKIKAQKEAEAEKIRVREEAKAEAARVKAEQKAKAEAAALAKQAAKAEAARLAAEQKAKIKAEKQAAALARQAAEAEAARLAAEQKAKIKAEKEAAALAKQAAEAEAAKLAAEQKAEAEKRAAVLAKQAAEAKVARLRTTWIMVGENKILGLTAYADPDTEAAPRNAKKNGDKLKMWKIYDYETTQEASGYKFISARFQDEYDCKEGKIRLLVNTTFSGNMGVGEVVFTNADAGKWQSVRPGSTDEAMWKFACRKK